MQADDIRLQIVKMYYSTQTCQFQHKSHYFHCIYIKLRILTKFAEAPFSRNLREWNQLFSRCFFLEIFAGEEIAEEIASQHGDG